MKVHLRLTEKDMDLCRWRHSIKTGMMTYYVGQILRSEAQGEIAYLPNALSLSIIKDPCDVYMVFTDPDIISFLQTFPPYGRNAMLKKIIRKHLRAQTGQTENCVIYPVKTEKKSKAVKMAITPQKMTPMTDKPINAESKKEIVESQEDRAAILALIAMGGE